MKITRKDLKLAYNGIEIKRYCFIDLNEYISLLDMYKELTKEVYSSLKLNEDNFSFEIRTDYNDACSKEFNTLYINDFKIVELDLYDLGKDKFIHTDFRIFRNTTKGTVIAKLKELKAAIKENLTTLLKAEDFNQEI